ncbi:hypothetical protein BDN70DRAFT_193273 [Pholiota conissans]|uniref:Uncharacterized protein n=1 Tax=Pholiota conissans TaxID=109636 RepID=A0A9P6CWW9_9AGAR|nr:hypothetical protein BDN70DRAFT_193273 [Pholiota conissans]
MAIGPFDIRLGRIPYKNSVNPLADDDADLYEIEQWATVLVLQWRTIWIQALYTGHHSGMGLFHGVHGMIELAFESRAKATQYFHARRDLYLPAFPWKITADVITYAGIPCDWANSLFRYLNYYTFSTDEHFRMLVTFVCMADSLPNPDNGIRARRRLALALCSAQHQRRALGFPDRSVFGATLVGTKLFIFEAEWETHIDPNHVVSFSVPTS